MNFIFNLNLLYITNSYSSLWWTSRYNSSSTVQKWGYIGKDYFYCQLNHKKFTFWAKKLHPHLKKLKKCIIYLSLISFCILSIILYYLVKCTLDQAKKLKETKNFGMITYEESHHDLDKHLFKLMEVYYILNCLFHFLVLNFNKKWKTLICIIKLLILLNFNNVQLWRFYNLSRINSKKKIWSNFINSGYR